MTLRNAWTITLLFLGAFSAVLAQPSESRLSESNASYRIEAHLDADAKMLTARQTLHWRNLQDRPARELKFHLYWNAWRNERSVWMLDNRVRRRRGTPTDIREEDWGWLVVDRAYAVDPTLGSREDLTSRLRYDPPEEYPEDRTVLVLELTEPVLPGATIEIEMGWRAKIPRIIARTGYHGEDFFFIAHWFPKLGVFEPEGWNCHPFHGATEFYSDFGSYDVRLDLPEDFVVGATGRRIAEEPSTAGRVSHRFRQHDVHGFAWTASPNYLVRESTFEDPDLPPVQLTLLVQPEHAGQTRRHFDATERTLATFGRWFGPYPYAQLTIVDPPFASGAGGMEYPTLFTAGTRLFNPQGGDSPEGVTVHETGHQFWYGLVGNNEFEHAWIDEGLTSYAEVHTMESYGARKLRRRFFAPPHSGWSSGGFFPLLYDGFEVPRLARRIKRYRELGGHNEPSLPTYEYYPASASAISYDKTALWLTTLERHLGDDTLQEILSTFFTRFRYGHPRPEDLFEIVDEVSGQDLAWFFEQVYESSREFDYAVDSVSSEPVRPEGYHEEDGELTYHEAAADDDDDDDDEPDRYFTTVVVQRREEGVFPVDVRLVFEDGEEVDYPWDGRARWKRISLVSDSELRYAQVDPDRVLMLDTRQTNNSLVFDPRPPQAGSKWASKWMIWLQDLFTTFALFV